MSRTFVPKTQSTDSIHDSIHRWTIYGFDQNRAESILLYVYSSLLLSFLLGL